MRRASSREWQRSRSRTCRRGSPPRTARRYRDDSRSPPRATSARPKASAVQNRKIVEDGLTVDEVLETMRSACDSIEDHSEELGTVNALRLLRDTVQSLLHETNEGKSPAQTPEKKGELTPQFTKKDAHEAQRAVQQAVQMINEAFKNVAEGKSAGAATQISLTFDRTAKAAKDVATRLANLFVGNPTIPVEFLTEEAGLTWRKPASSAWFAEKGGDHRKVVFRVNVPPRSTYRKASKMSLQFTVETKTLTIQSTRANLIEFAAPLVAAFGPVGRASPLQAASVDINVAKYLPSK